MTECVTGQRLTDDGVHRFLCEMIREPRVIIGKASQTLPQPTQQSEDAYDQELEDLTQMHQ